MRFLIVDDNRDFIDVLRQEIRYHYSDAVCEVAEDFKDISLMSDEYDVIFLDVMIHGEKSVDYALSIKKKFKKTEIVFMSDFNELVFDTQTIRPLCFIRKSELEHDFMIFSSLLKETMNDGVPLTFQLDIKFKKEQPPRITINSNDILYVECYLNHLIIRTLNKEYVTKLSLKEFLKEVETVDTFVRVHRSYVINMSYIYKISYNRVYLVNDQSSNEIPVGRKYKLELKEAFDAMV